MVDFVLDSQNGEIDQKRVKTAKKMTNGYFARRPYRISNKSLAIISRLYIKVLSSTFLVETN